MKLVRDGVTLAFEVAGSGPQAFVFIHGLGGNRTHFAPQLEHFSRNGRALVVELRGHGDSDKPQQAYPVEGFAEDVIWLCRQLGIERPVIAGQSLGGNITLEITARAPELAAAAVILDSAILFPDAARAVFDGYLKGLSGPDYRDAVRRIIDESCLPTDRCKPQVVAGMLATPQHVLASAFAAIMPWEAERARACIRACQVPLLYVEAANRITDLDELARLYPRLMTGKVVGSGHFVATEVPAQANAMIERFVELCLPAP